MRPGATKDGRATLATVAAAAGVSVATVSKVLNGRSDVASATRGLIQELLERYEYAGRPGDSVRRAAPTVRPSVELVYAGDLNAYSTEVLQGVLDAGAELGVAVVVSLRTPAHRRSDMARPAAWAGELAAAGRRAVIAVVDDLTSADLAALSRARLPLVVIDPVNLPHVDVTSVGSTNFAGGAAATRHLLALGHRRIAYVGGPPTSACNQARMHGYRAAMEAAGEQVPPDYVRFGNFRHEDGLVNGAALLDLPAPPTAVFAGSDESAVGVVEAARARGLRVPEDLSVVGFDDTQIARLASPALTTVRQPLQELGKVALRTAIHLADDGEADSHHVELATELVVRQSTARAPSSPATSDEPQ